MSKHIEITFVGHQTWLLSAAGTNVLVDPILGTRFGNSIESMYEMRLYPPRRVDFDAMPEIHAAIVSHEHIDHFNLETFARLPRTCAVLVGKLMLDSVVRAIEALGFSVRRFELGEVFRIGAFSCALYPATAVDVGYERRVTQMHFWTAPDCNVYNAVDCGLSPQLLADIEDGRVPAVRNLILSNNGMWPTDGARRAYYNINERAADSREGISCLRDIFDCVQQLPSVEHVYLMGNGLLPWGGEYGPFIWSDNAVLATLVNELSQGPIVFGPYPGDQYVVSPSLAERKAPWIEFDRNEMAALEKLAAQNRDKPRPEPLPALTRPFESDDAATRALVEVEAELQRFAHAFLASDIGQTLQVLDDPQYPDLGPRRLVMRFQGGPGGRAVQYALDVNRAAFLLDDTPRDALVDTFPHGIEMQLCDFHAIVTGRLGVWDIFFAPVPSWYPESKDAPMDHILTAMGNVYGEQARPDLACRINERAVLHYSK
jgi:L-ascorbate metabolism protein UlaG (beta-lactamase superfamily)